MEASERHAANLCQKVCPCERIPSFVREQLKAIPSGCGAWLALLSTERKLLLMKAQKILNSNFRDCQPEMNKLIFLSPKRRAASMSGGRACSAQKSVEAF
jgi:hypothetical protein